MATQSGIRVNMTLCFAQEQAAAVYAATHGAKKGAVFVSPFIGRIDDIGQNGMDLIKNIVQMYKSGDGHVEVLAASVRTMNHFMESMRLGADIITAPLTILTQWSNEGKQVGDNSHSYYQGGLKTIPYVGLDLNKDWKEYTISHELTDQGIQKFAHDWNGLIGGEHI